MNKKLIINLLIFLFFIHYSAQISIGQDYYFKGEPPSDLPRDKEHKEFFNEMTGKEKTIIHLKCYECHLENELKVNNHTPKTRCLYCHKRRL
jgi:hypothetical protein